MRQRVGIAVTALALALVGAGCTSHPKPAAPGPNGSSLVAWHDCTNRARALNPEVPRQIMFDCGTAVVPQDWSTADNGKTFKIALMRARSLDPANRKGSVVMNPGGPGGSGVDYLPSLAQHVTGLLQHFDVVGFDPRGVGSSDNVKCISNADLDAQFGYEPDPVSQASFDGEVALSRHIADGCGQKFGEELRLFSTEQTARDLDVIRAAVGDDKLTYLGFSYGTLLGAVYAEIFPTKLRAAVLDGTIDPRETPVQASEGQAMGFEKALENFSAWCSANPSRCPIAADPKGAIAAALANARTAPAKDRTGRVATEGWVFWSIASSLYDDGYWEYFGQSISDLSKGDPRRTFVLADGYAQRDPNGTYSTLFDANNAVNCADANYPTIDEVRSLQTQWRAKYPLFGAPLAIGMLTCSVWPAKKDPYPVGPATGAPPILLVGTTGDPATPYESTAKLADMLGVGQILTWDGQKHTAYPETTCVRNAVDNYLVNLVLPAKGLHCPPTS